MTQPDMDIRYDCTTGMLSPQQMLDNTTSGLKEEGGEED